MKLSKDEKGFRSEASKPFRKSEAFSKSLEKPQSFQKNYSRLFAGILLIVIGLTFFLKMLGIINFSVGQSFKYYWPIGLILVGVALILRMRWLAVSFLFLTLLFGALYIGSEVPAGDYREVVKDIPIDDITTLDLDVSYGAGDLRITDGKRDSLVKHTAKTSDFSDPEIRIEKTGNKAEVSLERKSNSFRFWHALNDEWTIEISPDVEVNLDLDYGATDSKIDMKNLKVVNLDLDTGATGTEIIFGNYPTKVKIDTGASSIDLKFPEGIGVAIEVDGGAVSTELKDFTKKDGMYFSENFDENEENIEIEIDAGATSINGGFY